MARGGLTGERAHDGAWEKVSCPAWRAEFPDSMDALYLEGAMGGTGHDEEARGSFGCSVEEEARLDG